jgi:hypothetical protein
MDWFHLGHASWLAEAAGLRLLFDPLVDALHHGGVFEVVPRRTLAVDALRADFVFVSHRHPDHFDIQSLRKLCAADPDSVVVTPDALVERCARRIGFRTVRNVAPGAHVELDGVRFVTTPSSSATGMTDTTEWGVMVSCDGSVFWNQVDTVHESVAAVRQTVTNALGALDARQVSLAAVRWHPLLEVEAMLAGSIGFPHRSYGSLLEQIGAIGARAIVPASAGAQHALPFDFMNRLVYPVPETRFLRDIGAFLPGIRAFPATLGACFHLEGGEVSCDATAGTHLFELAPDAPDPRRFRPLAIEELRDPNLDGRDQDAMRALIERWVNDALAPSLLRPISTLQMLEPVRLVLEVVLPTTVDEFTIVVEKGSARVDRRFEDDHDALVSVAGSMLCDVIEGIRHFGDPLLAGLLRASTRAYRVDQRGARPAPLAPIFLYYAISYEQSVVRAVEHALSTTG